MCYNAPVSFITFIIGVLFSMILWRRNKRFDRWNSLFILSFIFVQLGEALVWIDYSQIGFSIILLSVALQPVMQSFGLAYFEKRYVFFIPVIIGLLFLTTIKNENLKQIGPNHHLIWKINTNYYNWFILYYFTFLFIPLLFQKNKILILYAVFTCLFSILNYYRSREFSSMWCYLAIGYAVLSYISN